METSCTDESVRDELEDEAVGPGLSGTWKPPALMDLSVMNWRTRLLVLDLRTGGLTVWLPQYFPTNLVQEVRLSAWKKIRWTGSKDH
jgi:hypothetical protein